MSDNIHGGIDFFGLLQILLIGLKLTGYITWSWWWVLSPMLCSIAILIIIIVGAVIVTKK